ncbi:hypothetical protein [Kribbella sp. NPDC055071]
MTENTTPAAGGTSRSQFPGLFGLLDDLHREVAARLPEAAPSDTKYRMTRFGRTRVTKDGQVQVGRRDAEVLRQLAERTGPIDDPKQYARTTAALENVIAAQAQLIANPTGRSHDRFHPRIFVQEAADGTAGAAVAGAAFGVGDAMPSEPLTGNLTDVPQMLSLISKPIADAMHLQSPWQVGVAVGGAVATLAVANAWNEARSNEVLERGVERAWAQTQGPAICKGLGVADRLPGVAAKFSGARLDGPTATAHQLGGQLGAYTEQDKAAALTAVVQAQPADRAAAVVNTLIQASTLEDVAPQTRAQAAERVYDAIRDQGTWSGKGRSMVNGAIMAIMRDAPEGASLVTVLPKAAGLHAAADPAQSRTIQVALGDYPQPGSVPAEQTGSGPQPADGTRTNLTQATRDTTSER